MGYLIGDWPSYDPHNFSQLRPSDPAQPTLKILPLLSLVCFIFPFHITIRVLCSSFLNLFSQYISKKLTPATYHPTHSRTSPPPNQVISTEDKNILLRHFYQKAEEKLRPRRAASDNLMPEHASKQP